MKSLKTVLSEFDYALLEKKAFHPNSGFGYFYGIARLADDSVDFRFYSSDAHWSINFPTQELIRNTKKDILDTIMQYNYLAETPLYKLGLNL